MLLICGTGPPKRVCAAVRSLIGAHSAKPPEARERLGEVPRVELFARQAAPGRDGMGNGIDGRDIREVLGPMPVVAMP